jgi:hypothetical protein
MVIPKVRRLPVLHQEIFLLIFRASAHSPR